VNPKARRLIVPMAVVTAIALIVAWFPLRTMLSQSGQLNAASNQIATLNAQSQQLAAEQRALSTDAAAIVMAREQYQLLEPGQRLIQILSSASSGSLQSGDPGYQPLVSPSNVRDLIPVSATLPPRVTSSDFWSRLERTLEFWR
jgi:cell division protein FtsL